MKRFILIVAALIFATTITTPAQAQGCSGSSSSQSCSWSATVTAFATLNCNVTRSFDFGSAAIGSILESSEDNHGRLLCSVTPGQAVSVSFNLATQLYINGVGPQTVPFTYGVEAASIKDGTSEGQGGGTNPLVRFSPFTGVSGYVSTTGDILVTLGSNGPNTPEFGVFVDLTNAIPGTYSGQIVATIVLQ